MLGQPEAMLPESGRAPWYLWGPLAVIYRFYRTLEQLIGGRQAASYLAAQSFLTMAFSYLSFLIGSQLTRYYVGPSTTSVYVNDKGSAVEVIKDLTFNVSFVSHVAINTVLIMGHNYTSYAMCLGLTKIVQAKLNSLDQDPKLFYRPDYVRHAKTIAQVVHPKNAENCVKGGTEILCEMLKQGGDIYFISTIVWRDLQKAHVSMDMWVDVAYIGAIYAVSVINGKLYDYISQEKIAYDKKITEIQRLNHAMENRSHIVWLHHHALYTESLNRKQQNLYDNTCRRLLWHALQHGTATLSEPLMLVARLLTVAHKIANNQITPQDISVYLELFLRVANIGGYVTKVAKARDDFELSEIQLKKGISILTSRQQIVEESSVVSSPSHTKKHAESSYVTIYPGTFSQTSPSEQSWAIRKPWSLKAQEYWQFLTPGDQSNLLLRMLADLPQASRFNGKTEKCPDLSVIFIDIRPYAMAESYTFYQYCGFKPDLNPEAQQAVLDALTEDWLQTLEEEAPKKKRANPPSPRLDDLFDLESKSETYWQKMILSATLHRVEQEYGKTKKPVLLLLNQAFDLLSAKASKHFREKMAGLVRNYSSISVLEASIQLSTFPPNVSGGGLTIRDRSLDIASTLSIGRASASSDSAPVASVLRLEHTPSAGKSGSDPLPGDASLKAASAQKIVSGKKKKDHSSSVPSMTSRGSYANLPDLVVTNYTPDSTVSAVESVKPKKKNKRSSFYIA